MARMLSSLVASDLEGELDNRQQSMDGLVCHFLQLGVNGKKSTNQFCAKKPFLESKNLELMGRIGNRGGKHTIGTESHPCEGTK